MHEALPHGVPEALENSIILTHYADANPYHDFLTWYSVTLILHFINQIPFGRWSKKHATTKTATCGLECVDTRI